MKKAINVLTIIVIISAFFLVNSRWDIKIEAPGTFTGKVEKKIGRLFEDFPLDKQKFVDFEVDEDTFKNFTQREQKDQVLDWLLYTTVYSSGITMGTLSETLYDLPPIRYGYMHPVANFEFGDIRSCVIGDNNIIALIPQDIPDNQYKDYLARIADRHRKDLGKEPKIIHLFRYKIDLKERYALVKRCRDVNAGALFTGEYGYYTSTVKNLDDFKRFMEKIEDLTYAEVAGEGLKLGGRKLKEHYRGIQVEDVAAIWQAEKEIQDRLEKMMREDLKKTLMPDSTGVSLDTTYDFTGLQKHFSDPGHLFKVISSSVLNLIKKEEIRKALEALHDNKIVPLLVIIEKLKRYDYEKAKRFAVLVQRHRFQIARYDGPLEGTEVGMVLFYTDLLAKLWTLDYLNSIPGKEVENFIPLTAARVSPIYKQELLELTDTRLWFGLNNKGFQEIGDGNQLLFARVAARAYAASLNPRQPWQEAAPNAGAAAFLGWWNDHYEEIARYEQQYQRLNEVMKWSVLIAWLNDANKGHYLDFLQKVNVYKGNRFTEWIKSQQNLKFKKWDKVKFYRPGYLGTDTESEAILSFREYECFGQQWTISGRIRIFSTLKKLFKKFTKTNRLKGYPSYIRIQGQYFNLHKIKNILPLSNKIKGRLIRSHLDYTKTTIKDSYKILRTLNGESFTLQKVTTTKASVMGIPKKGANLRGSYSEIRHQGVEQIFSSKARGLEVETKIGENPLGLFNITRDKSGFKIGWKSRDIEAGQSIARKMSKFENPVEVLKKDSRVESVICKDKGNVFFIKMNQSENWLKIALEKKVGAWNDRKLQLRVSDVENGLKNYQIGWVKKTNLGGELRWGNSDYINIKPLQGRGKDVIVVSPKRGPPAFSKPFEINYGNFKVKGKVDPKTGDLFIKKSSIPKNIRDKPGKLQNLISESDLLTIRNTVISSVEKITLKRTKLPDKNSFARFLRNKDYKNAAVEIVKNPQGLKTRLRENLKNELHRNKAFQDAGHYSRAIHHLDHLIEIYGPLPGLKIRKGITLLKRQRYTAAKDQFHQAMLKSSKNQRAQYLNEINSHLGNSSVRFQYKEPNKSYWESLLRNTNSVQMAKKTKIGRIIKSNAPIYIQDSPGLTNLDWSPAAKTKNLTQAIRGQRVVKLMNIDIGNFKPEIIYAPDTLVKNLPVKSSPGKQIYQFKGHAYPYRFVRCYSSDNEDDDWERKSKYIYLILAEPQKNNVELNNDEPGSLDNQIRK